MVPGQGDEYADEQESPGSLPDRYAFKMALLIGDQAVLVTEYIVPAQEIGG